ncbi:hypothetical protein V2A60_007028 [Cordyceps javanica]|uniref:RNase MRP protein 1 RNA binding domain-containing protein n=1 Tax=Cordyceps javanica TaxID=43265 RepID=A0A545US85_9HYPO|nr:hypothetical protein IF1G_08857 [Cordyceps javanica]TQW04418.1 hypothetical protein IF2G_08188 [Cordyceps javanica]
MDHSAAAAAADVGLTSKLASLLPILDAFQYRHRNQHATSHWWSAFQLLRRGARSLAADLRRHQALGRPQADGGKRSTAAKGRSKISQKQVLARTTLFRNHIIPKAYLSFSQLVADNQHAALGLLLLSTLASINDVVNSVLPPSQEPTPLSSVTRNPAPDTYLRDSASKLQHTAVSRDLNHDRGVAISRNDFPDVTLKLSKPSKPTTSASTEPKSSDKARLVPGMKKADERPKKKAKKKGKDELSSLFGSL